jgi:hypothetical protein
MRRANKTLIIAVTMVLSLGLLYLQVCDTICALQSGSVMTIGIAVWDPVGNSVPVPPQAGDESADQHCHHSSSPASDSRPEPSRPSRQGDCHLQNLFSFLPPPTTAGTGWLNPPSLPDVIAPFGFGWDSFGDQADSFSTPSPLRSPPRPALQAILRI